MAVRNRIEAVIVALETPKRVGGVRPSPLGRPPYPGAHPGRLGPVGSVSKVLFMSPLELISGT